MRKLLFLSMVSLLILSCNSNETKDDSAAPKNDDGQTLYDQNLAVVKSIVTDFENKNLTGFFTNVADSVVWNSPVYGDNVHTNAHWMESLKYWTDNWDSLHLINANFLPGLDSSTHSIDGSVRYYGQWDGVHKATGIHTHVLIYETYEFNKDHKIVNDAEYFDVGGLMNAVQPKAK
jgi:hypothetical protein